jgi:hypothetical protein
LAYAGGHFVGEQAYKGIDALVTAHTGDSIAGNTIRDHYRAAYGLGSPLDADPETAVRMATATTQRYSGWSGLVHAMTDSGRTAIDGMATGVGTATKGPFR